MESNRKRWRTSRQDRIDVHSPQDVRTWAMALGVSEQSLKRAVDSAGNHAQRVREFFNGKSE